MRDAQAKGGGSISRVPHYNTAFKYMEKPELFSDPAVELIERTSSAPRRSRNELRGGFNRVRLLPFREVVRISNTTASARNNNGLRPTFATGVKTNVITAIEIHGSAMLAMQHSFPALGRRRPRKTSTMKEISADKGYTGNPDSLLHAMLGKCGGLHHVQE